MILSITVKPNSKTDEIVLLEDGTLKLKIKAQPIDGQANEYLVKFLAKKLGIAKSKIIILKGLTNPYKKLEIDMEETEVKKKLNL